MSEFSESFHFLGLPDDLLAAVASASLVPVVVDVGARWTSFVWHKRGFQSVTDDELAEVGGTLVRWVFASDEGWVADILEEGERVFRFEQSWAEGPGPGRREGDLDAAASAVDIERAMLEQLLSVQPADEDAGTKRAYTFAAALDLPAYEWVSWDACSLDAKAVQCRACGTVSFSTDDEWVCISCEGTESVSYPPPAGQRVATPPPRSALAVLSEQLAGTLKRLAEAGDLDLRGGAVQGLADDLAEQLESLVDTPNREAELAEWLMDHPAVEDLYLDDAALWKALCGPLG